MKSEECPDSGMAKMWRTSTTMEQFLFGRLGAKTVGVSSVVIAIWLVSFVQIVYQVIQTFGRGCCQY